MTNLNVLLRWLSLSVPFSALFLLGNLFIDDSGQCIPSVTLTYTAISLENWWVLLVAIALCSVGIQTGMEARSGIVTAAII